jgi:hypothetical protein
MLSIEQCKKILNKDKKRYEDDEVKAIREWLMNLSKIEVKLFIMKGAGNECSTVYSRLNAGPEAARL